MISGWRCSHKKLIKLVVPGYLWSNLKISATEFQDDLTIAIESAQGDNRNRDFLEVYVRGGRYA